MIVQILSVEDCPYKLSSDSCQLHASAHMTSSQVVCGPRRDRAGVGRHRWDGEVLLLDMGEIARILGCAKNMVRLSGLTLRESPNPQENITMEIIGVRPGEKLYEELLIARDISGTEHPRILRAQERKADWKRLEEELLSLDIAMGEAIGAAVDVRELLGRWVAGYGAR